MFSRKGFEFIFTSIFNSLVVLLIIGDATLSGFEASDPLLPWNSFWVGNCIVSFAMMGELALKVRAFGYLILHDIWDIIDCSCVLMLVFDTTEWLVYGRSSRSLWLRCFSLFRIGRLSKCLAGLRDNETPILTHFLRNTRPVLSFSVYSFALLCLLCLIGGLVLSSDLVPKLSAFRSEVFGNWVGCQKYIGDIYVSMFTCFQAITLDAWFTQIERPLIRGDRWVASCVLLGIVLGGSIVYSSLLVGAFVDRAKKTSLELSEAATKANESVLGEIRSDLHSSLVTEFGSRNVGLDEIVAFTTNSEVLATKLDILDITPDDICSLWRTLDFTGCDIARVETFKFAWERIHALGRGRDILEVQSSLSHAYAGTQSVEGHMTKLANGLKRMDTILDQVATFVARNDII
jgi:hypothetical protein